MDETKKQNPSEMRIEFEKDKPFYGKEELRVFEAEDFEDSEDFEEPDLRASHYKMAVGAVDLLTSFDFVWSTIHRKQESRAAKFYFKRTPQCTGWGVAHSTYISVRSAIQNN